MICYELNTIFLKFIRCSWENGSFFWESIINYIFVSFPIQSKCGETRARKTPNTNLFKQCSSRIPATEAYSEIVEHLSQSFLQKMLMSFLQKAPSSMFVWVLNMSLKSISRNVMTIQSKFILFVPRNQLLFLK